MSEKRHGRSAVEYGPTAVNVAANIRRIRKARGLSTYKLADRLTKVGRPIAPSAISKVERCERQVTVDDLAGLAAALDVQMAQLLLPPSELEIEIRIGGGGEGR